METAIIAAPPAPQVSYDDALKHFDSPADMARWFGVSRASVSEWMEKGGLPEGRVWQLIALLPEKFGHLKPLDQTAAQQQHV